MTKVWKKTDFYRNLVFNLISAKTGSHLQKSQALILLIPDF